MSPQIEILEIILLFTGIAVFTFGFAGLKFNLADKIYFKYIFAGILVLSFISFQMAVCVYLIKFDLNFGWNAAFLIFALASIIVSPFLLRIIHSFKVISIATVKPHKQIRPAKKPVNEGTKSISKPLINKEPEAVPKSFLPVIPTEESFVDNTKPFGITPDDVESEANIALKQTEGIVPLPEKESINNTSPVVTEDAPKKIEPAEQIPEDLISKKQVTKKSTPVKKSPARKHSSKSKRRRKR